jgi:CBS domain-containing protein
VNVDEIMTPTVKACGLNSDLASVAMDMWNHHCGSVPVVDEDGRPIGIITDRDIAMAGALKGEVLRNIRISEVIQGHSLHCCRSEDSVQSALKTIWAENVRRLPVVNGDGRLAGILSVDDIVACAERGKRGHGVPALSYDDAMNALKAVCRQNAVQ